MDDDSHDDSIIVRGQREKSKKRKTYRREISQRRDHPWRNISYLRVFFIRPFFRALKSSEKTLEIGVNGILWIFFHFKRNYFRNE